MIDAAYGDWLARGQAHQRSGLPIDAMLCFRQALTINRHAVVAQHHLGEVLGSLRQRAEAIEAWRAALAMQPQHLPSRLALATELFRSGAHAEALVQYRQALAIEPHNAEARMGAALTALAKGDEDRDHVGATAGALIMEDGAAVPWDDVAQVVAALPASPARSAVLARIVIPPPQSAASEVPALLLAAAAEESASRGDAGRVRALVAAASSSRGIDQPETLRYMALATEVLPSDGSSDATVGSSDEATAWAERYARRCREVHAPALPVLWPRRTAGDALRVAWLLAPGGEIEVAGARTSGAALLESIVSASAESQLESSVFVVDATPVDSPLLAALRRRGVRVACLGHSPDPSLARHVGEADFDALIDLAGMSAATGPLLAAAPARSVWTIAGMRHAHAAALVGERLPAPARDGDVTSPAYREKLERAIAHHVKAAPWFSEHSAQDAAAMAALWRNALGDHQAGRRDEALAGYAAVLTAQPGFAPAEYFTGVLLRDGGAARDALPHFISAVQAAPRYADARAAWANLLREGGDAQGAVDLCKAGLDGTERDLPLLRSLGLAELARHDARLALEAFAAALAIAPTDAQTHFNHGVALQSLRRLDEALRAYQRAHAFDPALVAAEFNIGGVLQEQGRNDAAVRTFESVLARDPGHVLAYKALGDSLLAERRIDEWLAVFARFERARPRAVSLVAWALEACQYRADFPAIERFLERLRRQDFVAEDDVDLADSMEQILFLMHYFDLEPAAQLALYRSYDAVAQRVYGAPLPPRADRQPGRLRIGYLSGDLRNHVMGKQVWQAIRHHDRARFAIYCYATTAGADEMTDAFRAFAHSFVSVAELNAHEAALRIAADDLDVLVDLSTHTKNAMPGILARKPARVQITHIASAGALGLSTVDFKLTDAICDPPENQAFLIERLLPMQGCVYPYRHVEAAAEHPFQRSATGGAEDAILIGAFVNPLKLSRRCLDLWRQVLDAIPRARLVISPLSREATGVYARLFVASGIAIERVTVLPQGRNDSEGLARYSVLDFCLDPMPYGGVNGTLEALDMEVPVVTLMGRKHSERTSASILVNLGVPQTIAQSGSEYVALCVRLAVDGAFRSEVKAAIAAGLRASPLVDMPAHARALEAAYIEALSRTHPHVLAQAAQ